jgi:putative phosphoribosyl transferase
MIAGVQYRNRCDAGSRLACELAFLAPRRPLVVALARGGVPVAAEVARALRAPLEPMAVRKVGAPGNPELAVGAVAEEGGAVLDMHTADVLGMSSEELEASVARESERLRGLAARLHATRAPASLAGQTVVAIDDGLATGMTMLAAVRALRARKAAKIVVAVPVGSREAASILEGEADQVICLTVPRRLYGVGMWYQDFRPVDEDEVLALLADPYGCERELSLQLDGVRLAASLIAPDKPRGLIVFAHGSGSTRLSARNRAVAQALRAAGFGSLLFDLLGDADGPGAQRVFDVDLLSRRLREATGQLAGELAGEPSAIGYFGASTGAAAALCAAAALGGEIAAVVSRGGRPDLARQHLDEVLAPTLLIVGERDGEVLELNRCAAEQLRCAHELVVIERAGHLFEESGALQRVSELAVGWFDRYLG